MGRQASVVLYVLAMVIVVVVMDLLFFRNHFWPRGAVERRGGSVVRRVLLEVRQAFMNTVTPEVGQFGIK